MSVRARIRHAAALSTPVGILQWRERRLSRRRKEFQERVAVGARELRGDGSYSPEAAVRFLVGRGLDEYQVRDGSIPPGSLEFAGELVRRHVPEGRPLCGLHVGNFLGVSLSYFTWLLRELHPDSVVVSVDPNIRHRGIDHPQDHVLALLGHFDLLRNSVVVPGYTLEQNFGDEYTDRPEERHLQEAACVGVLSSMARLGGRRFDVALLDGNHDGEYLSREFAAARELLAERSVLVLDDVTVGAWYGVMEVFERALEDDTRTFTELGRDDRVGVLAVRQEDA